MSQDRTEKIWCASQNSAIDSSFNGTKIKQLCVETLSFNLLILWIQIEFRTKNFMKITTFYSKVLEEKSFLTNTCF